MRRDPPKAAHPEVADSQAELEMLEGRKRNAHEETAAVARNKQRLEQDLTKSKDVLDAQIEERRKQLAVAEAAHLKRIEEHAREEREAKARKEAALLEAEQAERTLEDKKRVLAEQNVVNVERTNQNGVLASIEKRLRDSIGHLEPRVRILEKNKYEAEKGLEVLTVAHATATATHQKIRENAEQERQVLNGFVARIEEKKKEHAGYVEALALAATQLVDERAALTEVQKERAEHEQAMQKREQEANERMANATRLEQRIDQKLEQLKEVENDFTTDHLSRIGYKKIGA